MFSSNYAEKPIPTSPHTSDYHTQIPISYTCRDHALYVTVDMRSGYFDGVVDGGRLPLTAMSYCCVDVCAQVARFMYAWQQMAKSTCVALVQTGVYGLDRGRAYRNGKMHQLFLGSCDIGSGCGLVVRIGVSCVVAMVKIRIKPHNMFDIQLLCKEKNIDIATDIARELVFSLTV